MSKRTTGRYERTAAAGEAVSAFVPFPLPPGDPPLELGGGRGDLLETAEQALVKLDLASDMVPSLDWFLYAFVRKEALISSQIEGTQATLDDLLAFEALGETHGEGVDAASPDVEEVCNYLDALSYARRQLNDPKGLPLSMRLLHESHLRLMAGVRGADKMPGEIRRSQNWLGGSRPSHAAFVPPPPQLLPDLLSELERYLHESDALPPLVRAGLVHVQFETIHPYLDGNGRIGRLLVTLLLEQWGLLTEPLLYLSLFFKRHRAEYYRRLDGVRSEGDWEGWLDFFLEGVAVIAEEAVHACRDLSRLVMGDRQRVLEQKGASITTLRLFEHLPSHPIASAARVQDVLDTSKPTAGRAIEVLETVGILREITGKQRDRVWAYAGYLDLLRVGTELE